MTSGPRTEGPLRDRREPPANPRRVRRGVKLKAALDELAQSWAAHRWLRLIEVAASGAAVAEGLEYARLGQTRSMEVEPGSVFGFVQGRADRAYRTRLTLERFVEEQWLAIVNAMADQAVYAAKLLAGELPTNIEDLCAPAGVRLFPVEPGDVKTECTCKEPQPWCKHAVCLAYLLAERLRTEHFAIFLLRGMPADELLDRLRQRRSLSGTSGAAPVYVPRIEGVTDFEAPALDADPRGFWSAGPELRQVHAPLEPPKVSHPLLRRLGPSPFPESRFPLVGLLATCYELIGRDALEVPEDPAADTTDLPPADEPDED